jgi:hypothetical protein
MGVVLDGVALDDGAKLLLGPPKLRRVVVGAGQ